MTRYLFPILIIIATVLISRFSYCQTASKDISFANYLSLNQRYSESNFLLKKNSASVEYIVFPTQKDTINYLIGWNYYMEKKMDSSACYFRKVKETSTYYIKARFYASFVEAYLGKYKQADSLLMGTSLPNDTNLVKLKEYQQAGIYLLGNNLDSFDKKSESFKNDYYPISEGEKHMIVYREKITEVQHKSAFLAGMMSALLPGSGKFYAGYKGQAAGAFLPSFFLGAVAVENYVKDGYKSPNFIVFASLFSVFYVGNIWGSVLSVKMKQNEINNEIKHNILLDLHIPLRRIFN